MSAVPWIDTVAVVVLLGPLVCGPPAALAIAIVRRVRRPDSDQSSEMVLPLTIAAASYLLLVLSSVSPHIILGPNFGDRRWISLGVLLSVTGVSVVLAYRRRGTDRASAITASVLTWFGWLAVLLVSRVV